VEYLFKTMRKFLNWKFLLLAIVLLAAFLRFYQLGSNPPSLTWDETAWGYNAYSLGIDARDEFNRFLPYDYLESFGDFKPPMYAYLDIVPVKLFGLNEFATRFPSAFFGVLTVLITYFLVKRIFPSSKQFSIFPGLAKRSGAGNFQFSIAEMSAFLLAISPWHILLSRAAFEANIATFFIVTGVWLFLKGIQDKKIFLVLSFIVFVLSMYSFNTTRIVAPLIGLALTIGFRKEILKNKKIFIFSCLAGFIVLLPIIGFLLSPQSQLRFKEVNIFWDPKGIAVINQEIKNDNNQPWSKIIHNRRLYFSVLYMKHYFDNLSPSFLFIKGDGNPKFSVQNVGQMYLISLPFFVIGFFLLLKKKEKNWWIIPAWLLIGIIPAATARETPHALRIETTLPTFQIIVAYGIVVFMEWSRKQNLKLKTYNLKLNVILLFTFYLLLITNIAYFLHTYFSHYSVSFSGEWQYGYKESINYVKENMSKFDEVRVTTELGRPYAYYLFYLKIDPKEFRQNAVVERDVFGFVSVKKIDKFIFDKDLNKEPKGNKRILYINDKYSVPANAKVLKTFKLLNGEPILFAYTM